MKRIIFFLLFLLLNAVSFSQATLNGTIKNKQTQEALPGAVIYFPEFKSGMMADKDGNFKIEKLPKVLTLDRQAADCMPLNTGPGETTSGYA